MSTVAADVAVCRLPHGVSTCLRLHYALPLSLSADDRLLSTVNERRPPAIPVQRICIRTSIAGSSRKIQRRYAARPSLPRPSFTIVPARSFSRGNHGGCVPIVFYDPFVSHAIGRFPKLPLRNFMGETSSLHHCSRERSPPTTPRVEACARACSSARSNCLFRSQGAE